MYNAEKFIKECVASALGQTVPFEEIIIVDDGSSDRSLDICRDYIQENKNIKLYTQPNSGAAVARNTGLKHVTSEYVVFLDADDLLADNACEIIKSQTDKTDLDILYYSSEVLGYNELKLKMSKSAYYRSSNVCKYTGTGFDSLKIIYPNSLILSACMEAYKMKFLKEHSIEFPLGNIYEDRLFSLVTITEAENVKYIEDKLYIRRFFSDTTSTSKASERKMKDAFESHCAEWKYITHNKRWTENYKLMQSWLLNAGYMYFCDFANTHNNASMDCKYLDFFNNALYGIANYDCMDINDLCLLLSLINRMNSENALFSMKDNIVKRLEQNLRNLCRKYFEKNKKIVLYGLGRHTVCLKKIIEKYGEYDINDLLYVVSDINESILHDVFFVGKLSSDIVKKTDSFVLSSKVYQDDMCELLIANNVPPEKITKIYSESDSVDMVMIYDALSAASGSL